MILTEMKQRRSTTPQPRVVLIVYAAAAHKPTRPPKAHPRAPIAGRHCTTNHGERSTMSPTRTMAHSIATKGPRLLKTEFGSYFYKELSFRLSDSSS